MECLPRENGLHHIEWIYSAFGSCIYGYRDAFSIIFGYVSIFCWLNAQLPQMVQHYKSGSAEGLSLYLLYFWLAGDVGNMFSCVLNHQLPFQTYLSMYFVTTDLILLFQYFYFGQGEPTAACAALKDNCESIFLIIPDEPLQPTKTIEDVYVIPDNNDSRYGSTDNAGKNITTFMGLLVFGINNFTSITNVTASGSTVLASSDTTDFPITFGWVLAWICTSFYLLSRVPQIHKNYKRHSVQGLSLALFNFAVVGNVTYALSIFLHPGHTAITWLEATPYLVGSLGSLFLDAIIFGQFLNY